MKITQSNTQDTILKAVNKLADFIKPTYGKDGHGVLIDIGFQSSVIDDGFTIAEELEFEDPFENAVLKFIRETTRRTNKRAGDGTTTSILLLRSILDSLQGNEKPITEIESKLRKALDKAVKALRKMKTEVTTQEQLEQVAMVSFHNESIAKMIAELVFKTGMDGVISVEEHELLECSSELKEGFSFEKGYVSPYMATKPDMTAELVNPLIFVTESQIARSTVLLPLLQEANKTGRNLLIVGDIDGEGLQNLLVNKLKGALTVCVVKSPTSDAKFYQDIAIATGASVFSFQKGDKEARGTMCGTAEKAIITASNTIIHGSKGDPEKVKEYVEGLKAEMEKEEGYKKDRLKNRIGSLTNGVAVLRIGAMTDGERRYIKAKADDAVHATQLALKGVVKGGGVAFKEIGETGFSILDTALAVPNSIIGEFEGEVYDPVEVLIASLEGAVSIACTLLRSEGIITEKVEKNAK